MTEQPHPFMALVQRLTDYLDKAFNVSGEDRKVGFILLIFPINTPGIVGCTISTNGIAKEDVVQILKSQSDMLAAQLETPRKDN